jgi:hypothetical protein
LTITIIIKIIPELAQTPGTAADNIGPCYAAYIIIRIISMHNKNHINVIIIVIIIVTIIPELARTAGTTSAADKVSFTP